MVVDMSTMDIATTRPAQVVDIAKARTAAGVSKSELARRLGIPVRNVRRMENTQGYDPRFSRVVQIADALGVPTDALVPERAHGSNLPEPTGHTPQEPTNPHTNSTKNNGTARGDVANATPRADQKRG